MEHFDRTVRAVVRVIVTNISDRPDGELIARSRAAGQNLSTRSLVFFFFFREGPCGAGKTIAVELESHARSLVLAAKMSVYVMSAPLDNWHTRKSRGSAIPRGAPEGSAIFSKCSISHPRPDRRLTGMSRMGDRCCAPRRTSAPLFCERALSRRVSCEPSQFQ